MAKQKNEVMSDDIAQVVKNLAAAPKGWVKISDDVSGYWDFEICPIRGIPLSVKLFDGNIEPEKPSCLIAFRLTMDCVVRPPSNDEGSDEPIVAKKGEIVGVWYKPGMKKIRDLGGVEIWIAQTGEKDVGRPSPMKLFDVVGPEGAVGTRLPVTEDTRKESRPYKRPGDSAWSNLTPFDYSKVRSTVNSESSEPDDEPENDEPNNDEPPF